MPCTPADSASLGSGYPTSHDCPPPPGPLSANYIRALPIPLGLTTDPSGTAAAQHRLADNTENGQERFCGFCANAAGTSFKNPAVPCANNAGCTGVRGCPSGTLPCNSCRQRTGGAFGTASTNPGSEHEITVIGSPAGVCIADGAPQPVTLGSVFCFVPAFNATVDANNDLPGPGAITVTGQVRLLR